MMYSFQKIFSPNYIDTCKKAYDIKTFYSYSAPSVTSKGGLKTIARNLTFTADHTLRIILENKKKNIQRGPSSCMGNRHKKEGERKTLYEDMENLYGWSMSQYLPT